MNLTSKFRGCLVGGLLGDCLGSPFEGENRVANVVLHNYFNGIANAHKRLPFKAYTDDTAMTKQTASSLIEKKGFNDVDMAKRFVEEYFASPNRGYGANVVDVFAALRSTSYKDPYAPAKMQFGGRGSYGNGGAMRIAPVALFNYPNTVDDIINMARKASQITHANRLGYNGAILQCLAVWYALKASDGPLNVINYLDQLSSHMKAVEEFNDDGIKKADEDHLMYVNALANVADLLERSEDVSIDEVEEELGTSVVAHYSVPTAIYAFLRSFGKISTIKVDNPFQRTIQYAISLGGDTDTIAAMAGNIAGAYYGIDQIPDYLQSHCEDTQGLINLSDNILSIISNKI